jgi:hypothetical protein
LFWKMLVLTRGLQSFRASGSRVIGSHRSCGPQRATRFPPGPTATDPHLSSFPIRQPRPCSSSSPDAHAHALLCPAPPRLASSSPAARRRFRRGHPHPHSTTLLLRSPLSPPNLALPSTPTRPPAVPLCSQPPCILNRRRGPASQLPAAPCVPSLPAEQRPAFPA